MLRRLSRNCDLNDPMNVERYILGADFKNKSRNKLFLRIQALLRSKRDRMEQTQIKGRTISCEGAYRREDRSHNINCFSEIFDNIPSE
jgi:hypothetical protein